MPVPGLNPNIRLVGEPEEETNFDDIVVVNADEGGSNTEVDEAGNVLRIEHANGDITVSIDGGPISSAGGGDAPAGWFDNLADEIDDIEMSRIADTLLRGIEEDINTRSDWIEDRAQGLKLLGLKIELPGVQGTSDGAPVEGMSKVRHPLLLEAVLRFQANARSELLPTDGPVKIRDDSNNSGAELDKLAAALEKDMNHYLTVTASEYYPDTDRMLFMTGFGGDGFKKVFFCPLRNRPVSESIDAEDLIVNNAATDLENAKRITHRIMMRPSVVKRMQIIGAYRDIPLSEPVAPSLNAAQEERNAQQGVSNTVMNHEDRDREIYECYCELDIKGFEHKWKGAPSGLEVPYRVTIDVSSRQVLSIVRNYDEPDDVDELPTAKKVFVKYPFVPGLGFYDIGLLHILGNTTNAITAAWRELLDAGMFAAFPGFLMADQGARQNTNIFRVPPGGSATVKTNGMKISDAIMPLPYKEPSPALMTLAQNISEYGQRVGGTAEMAVGEGRQDAPVGTTLAIIDQATKVMNSVHKRLHAAQAEEFQLLKQCFKEHPESFWQRNRSPAYPWDEQTFKQALENYYLVPQADPNTASHTQRMMKTMALIQLAQTAPDMYDLQAVNKQALRTIGYNPDEFVKKDDGSPSPETMATMLGMEATKAKMANETMKTQADAALKAAQAKKTMADSGGQEGTNPADMMNAQAALMSAQNDRADMALKAKQLEVDNKDITIDGQNRAQERDSREKLAMVKLQQSALEMDHEKEMQQADMAKIAAQNAAKEKTAKIAAEAKAKAAAAKPKKPKPGLIG
jgi:uncharacterized OsmC-like protein